MRAHYAKVDVIYDLPSELLQGIGEVMVLCAHIEWKLTRWIYHILELTPEKGRLAVREPRAHERLRLLNTLLEISGGTPGPIREMEQEMEACFDLRDLLAHGVWSRDPVFHALRVSKFSGNWQVPGTRYARKVPRRVVPEGVAFDASDARDLAKRLRSLLAKLELWHRDIQTPAASFQKHPVQPR